MGQTPSQALGPAARLAGVEHTNVAFGFERGQGRRNTNRQGIKKARYALLNYPTADVTAG